MKPSRLVFSITTLFLILLGMIAFSQTNKQADEYFYLEWEKKGGYSGLAESLTITRDGSWNLKRRLGDKYTSTSGKLTLDQLLQIRRLIADSGFLNLEQNSFTPKKGVFDYHTYRLRVVVDGKSREVSWVDSWASSAPLPNEIVDLQEHIERFIAGELDV